MRNYFHRYPIKQLPKRISISIKAIATLLYFKPQYFMLALVVSVIFYEIIYWFLNLGLLQYLLTTPFLTAFDKYELVVGSYTGIFTQPYSDLAITLFLVSVLQGITVACIVYSIRHERTVNRSMIKEFGRTGVVGALSVFGLGCAACGTSLVTPMLTFFFATSSVALAEQVGLYSAVFALVIAAITLYLSGYKLASKISVPTK